MYRFWLHNGTDWILVRDWGSSTYTWTPAAAGSYYLGVWVKPSTAPAETAAATGKLPFAVQ